MITPEQRVLQELIDYQREYKEQTQDYAPGNRYWADNMGNPCENILSSICSHPLALCGRCGHSKDFPNHLYIYNHFRHHRLELSTPF